MRYVLMHAETQPSLYRGLFAELLTVAAVMTALWAILMMVSSEIALPHDPASGQEAEEPPQRGRGDWAIALLLHVLITGGLALLLLASDDKKQAVTGLFVASFVGATLASWSTRARPGAWLWAGPVLVGLIGYAAAWAGRPVLASPWSAGPLMRAAPLDYAGSGVAGAIVGRWVGVAQDQAARIALRAARRV
jgi:hypothetical protein